MSVDRVRHAGGAIYINSYINTKVISKSANDSHIEYMFVELSTKEDEILMGSINGPNRYIGLTPILPLITQISLNYCIIMWWFLEILIAIFYLIMVCLLKCRL